MMHCVDLRAVFLSREIEINTLMLVLCYVLMLILIFWLNRYVWETFSRELVLKKLLAQHPDILNLVP